MERVFLDGMTGRDSNKWDYLTLSNGERFTYCESLFVRLGFAMECDMSSKEAMVDAIGLAVELNQALYCAGSYLTRTLVKCDFESQMKTFESFIKLKKRANENTLELYASEWLLVARAASFVTDSILGAKSLRDGVDAHAVEILNDIEGQLINGVKAVVKASDVPFLQRVEVSKGEFVWENTLH